MSTHRQRVTVNEPFEAVLGAAESAIRAEGLTVVARIDVRDHCWRDLGATFAPYHILEAWPPQFALDALRSNPDLGAALLTTFGICELPDGRTTVVVREPFSAMAAEPGAPPPLVEAAERERSRIARIVDRLQHAAREGASTAQQA